MSTTRALSVRHLHASLLLCLALLLVIQCSPGAVRAQTSVVNIISYRVTGTPNYNAPGNESYWSNIGWTVVPLTASVSPGGGHTPNVSIKSANNGSNIYVLFQWSDPQGASYGSSPELYVNSKGQTVPLNYSYTGVAKQLVYNATYYYPDRVALLWFLTGARGTVPVMQLNSTGSITSGTADIWHWQSNPTDNVSYPTSSAGNYTDPVTKKTIWPPNNSSFAEDDYTNATGFFPIAGSISGSPNLVPSANPFAVLAGNYFSTASKTWTIEMVRPLTLSQATNYRVQLTVDSSYFVGFAVWNGRMGESAHIKSVSEWYSLTVSSASPPSGGLSLVWLIVAGAGVAAVGSAIAVLVMRRRKKPNVQPIK